MSFSIRGVKVPHKKNTAHISEEAIQTPSTVVIPMSMHIGKPSTPVVKRGDAVYVGTVIAEASGFISANIHSSVSGVVKGIGEMVMPSGNSCQTVIVESDGKMEIDPSIVPPVVNSSEDLVGAVAKAGLVGLGGAGFPTHVKLSVKEGQSVDELIINCAECEPYITSDTRTLIDRQDDMEVGINAIVKYLSVGKVVFGVEKNNHGVKALREFSKKIENSRVKILPSVYPQGAEKVLIYNTTGKVVPAGKLPIDVGCIVCNCTTVAEIGRYLKTGIPLVSKCVTVDGGCITQPKNLVVPIGTSVSELASVCGLKSEPCKIVMGGPMMGIALSDENMPVLKNTNAVLFLNEAESKPKRETACIKCGGCAARCPYGLNPAEFARALKAGDKERLVKLRPELCMECGSCTFLCPTGQHLAVTNKFAKSCVAEYKKSLAEQNKDGGNK